MVGKTRQGPLRPRLRAQRGRRRHPRRAVSSSAVPQEAWRTSPVPAIVAADTFAAVQEPLRANQRHARPSRRGALDLLQGLGQGQQCGDAFYGKRISHKAAKGPPRASTYDRCLGTDAYRFGGERVCRNTPGRTDLSALAVWREVCGLLAHPERLAAEYRRRLHPHEPARGTEYTRLEAQLGKRRQGLARLIDRDAEGLLEKHAFEPRIARLRPRLTHLDAQRQQLADDAAVQTEVPLIIGRLEDFAARVHAGLEEADWPRQREMIRALVKRVDVHHDQVHVVFRVDQQPGDLDAEKKVCKIVGGVRSPILANVYLHDALDLWFQKVVKPRCRGEACLLRYADDDVAAFQDQADAERFSRELGPRLGKFGLEVAPDKTRVIPCRGQQARGRTSVDFLGFEFRWGTSRAGKLHLKRRTARKKRRNSLKQFTAWCRETCRSRVRGVFQDLNAKLRGYYRYDGVHGNYPSLQQFFNRALRLLDKWLNRRSQRRSSTWTGFTELLRHFRVERPRLVGRPTTRMAAWDA